MFPQRVQNYLSDILSVIKSYNLSLVSIVLFGSLAKGGYKEDVSDVDLVFILNNQHSSRDKKLLDAIITQLEYKYGFRKETDSKIDTAYKIAENMTGMFISHFVCFEKDYLNARFARVFNVNPILSYLLAPSAIVWNSVVSSSKTIWGKNITPYTKPILVKVIHVIKSLLMNSLLNLMAYATYTLHKDSTKFAMEAVKWSLHSCFFCLEQQSASVEKVAEYFSTHMDDQYSDVLELLLKLRNNYTKSSVFIKKSITLIIKIHKFTLNNGQFPLWVRI